MKTKPKIPVGFTGAWHDRWDIPNTPNKLPDEKQEDYKSEPFDVATFVTHLIIVSSIALFITAVIIAFFEK